MGLFHGIGIEDPELIALKDIEKIIKENIPVVNDINFYSDWFGVVVEDNSVTKLGLARKSLT